MAEGDEKLAHPGGTRMGRRAWSLLGIFAMALGAYARIHILIPMAGAAVLGLVLWKARLLKDTLLIQAVSVQGGQALWMLLGVLLGAGNTAFRVELLGYALAVLVLALRPGKWIAIILLVYQCIALLINTVKLWSIPIGAVASRGLASYVSLRVAAIVLLIMLLRRGLPMAPSDKIAAVFE